MYRNPQVDGSLHAFSQWPEVQSPGNQKGQPTVSRNSTESEYRALSDAAQEVVWLHRLLQELNPSPIITSTKPPSSLTRIDSIDLHCDNQGAIKLSQNHVFHARSKHIEIQYHFIRERVLGGEIQLKYIQTSAQPADALTKPLGKLKLAQHRQALGLQYLHNLQSSKP